MCVASNGTVARDFRQNVIHVTSSIVYPVRRGSMMKMVEGVVENINDDGTLDVRRTGDSLNGELFSQRLVKVGTDRVVVVD